MSIYLYRKYVSDIHHPGGGPHGVLHANSIYIPRRLVQLIIHIMSTRRIQAIVAHKKWGAFRGRRRRQKRRMRRWAICTEINLGEFSAGKVGSHERTTLDFRSFSLFSNSKFQVLNINGENFLLEPFLYVRCT